MTMWWEIQERAETVMVLKWDGEMSTLKPWTQRACLMKSKLMLLKTDAQDAALMLR